MMRVSALLIAVASLAAMALPACRHDGSGSAPPAPTPTASGAGETLTKADMEMFLAVRGKALTRVEDEVAEVERQGGGGLLAKVVELSTAEQDAAASLGFNWQRYRWVREEIASRLAAQRRHEDTELLHLELSHARDDLMAQAKLAKDPASKQFLEAQIAGLNAQIEKLTTDRPPTASEAHSLEMIASVRAELAVQQGRQDRIQRRLRELMQRQRAAGAPTPAPRPVR
jgi:hypothetical protein